MAMTENDKTFCSAYNPADPSKMLIQQEVEDAHQTFAAAGGQAYTATQIVSNACSIIFNTGMLIEACQEWGRWPEPEKTWPNFKTHFAQAHTELGELNHTTQAAGYHNANNAMASFAIKTGEALANIATAMTADGNMLCSLQATNKALIQQNAVKDAEINQLYQQVQQYTKPVSPTNNNNNNCNYNAPSRGNNNNYYSNNNQNNNYNHPNNNNYN
jgi:hypothetical protein